VVSGDKSDDQILEEGRGYIKKLRELNDKIDDERLSAGMDRLEEISGSIFDYIAKHPEKAPKIRRFVNYYLPSTMKMLETYYTMSSQGVRRENISQTMERIEKVMDSLIVAYEKQLDILFSDEAIDISTDIDVLEGMFAQEGLGGSDFKKQ
jgi:5-bromo-4-chloroindolyl phosphate hydrolysis protein